MNIFLFFFKLLFYCGFHSIQTIISTCQVHYYDWGDFSHHPSVRTRHPRRNKNSHYCNQQLHIFKTHLVQSTHRYKCISRVKSTHRYKCSSRVKSTHRYKCISRVKSTHRYKCISRVKSTHRYKNHPPTCKFWQLQSIQNPCKTNHNGDHDHIDASFGRVSSQIIIMTHKYHKYVCWS